VVVVNTYTQLGGKKFEKRDSTTVFQVPTAVARKLESTVDSGGWEAL
jgi:hypothetical protein